MLTVRVAGPADLPELDAALPTGRNDVHAAFLRRQEAGDAAYLAAWVDGVPVGTGVLRWTGRDSGPEITNLQVEPAARGHGAGTALIRLAEDLVRARGLTQVSIAVGLDNDRAASLYRRLGYTDTGVRQTDTYTYFDPAGAEHEVTEHSRVLVRHL
ncbi:MAG TPA: GNAT family N-acetyltransferase [Mycobacteriales bacterium]